MKILLGITGSVGAQLTGKLYDKLKEAGHEVKVLATESAIKFLDHETRVKIDYITQDMEFDIYKIHGSVRHIEYAHWADCFLLCPCTSNTLNKWYNGICDNIVLSTLKAYEGPIYIAPVMNTFMLKKDLDIIHYIGRDDYSHPNIKVLWPTTKTLACGDVGLGAYPHLDDIVTIVSGHKWEVPNTFRSPGIFNYPGDYDSPNYLIDHPGWFGGKRKHDIHTGIDLYCDRAAEVFAFEDGVVVEIGPFTGHDAKCDWWYDSDFISIAGKSGTIIYGEIKPTEGLKAGDKIITGQFLGNVTRILKHEPKTHVIGHKMDMLHVELVETGKIQWGGEWKLNGQRPKFLKDPTIYLYGSEPRRRGKQNDN